MVQTILHKYFTPDPQKQVRGQNVPKLVGNSGFKTSTRSHAHADTHKITLLHLPFNVRRQIYACAGLPEGLDVSLNYWPPEGVCPQTLRSYRPGLNHLPSEDDYPEIYRNPYDGLPETPWVVSKSESLLYFLDGVFPHPAPRVHRIVRTGNPFISYSDIFWESWDVSPEHSVQQP